MEERMKGPDSRSVEELVAASDADPSARNRLEQLGYELLSKCTRCGALGVGRAHAYGCMGALSSVWKKKDEPEQHEMT